MDPDKKDPLGDSPTGEALDPASFLLPKKEGAPSVDSAQRIQAGALLRQEERAELPKPEKPATPPPPLAKEVSEINPLQTFKGDVEKVVSDRGVSVVSIAAAEADRAGKGGGEQSTPQQSAAFTLSAAAGGAVLLVAAVALLVYAVTRPSTVPVEQELAAPFISVDASAAIAVSPRETRATFMNSLESAREGTELAVGLIKWLYPAYVSEGTQPVGLSANEFLHLVAPNAPPTLMRTLRAQYLLGIHSFDENQAFLLLSVDSYETAYAGMLEWEYTMREDLSPLFSRVPSPSSATSGAYTEAPQVLRTGFVDKIVENRDVRAVVSPAGDILLLWTMLGRGMIVITTNEYTLRQVLSSLQTSPATP